MSKASLVGERTKIGSDGACPCVSRGPIQRLNYPRSEAQISHSDIAHLSKYSV